MLNKIKRIRKSQSGDAITWLIATLVIIFVLGIFIFISDGLAKTNKLSNTIKDFFMKDGDGVNADWISLKTELALEKNSDNEEVITGWIG